MRNDPDTSQTNRLLIGSFCATFLKPEMLHVYRQICGLQRYRNIVFTHHRENVAQFPYAPVIELPKAKSRFWRKLLQKRILRKPIQIYEREAAAFCQEMESRQIQLLHVYFGHIGVYLLPLLRCAKWPVIVSFHGADAGVDMDKQACCKAMCEVFALAKLVLVRSESLSSALQELGCPKEKIRLHRTGIPLEHYPFEARNVPSDGAWHFVQACRLIPKKGLDTTLHAFLEFCKWYPNAKLTIAGEGPLDLMLKAFVKKHALEDNVEFVGFLSQPALRALYYKAHIFVHPSRKDASGNQEGVPNSMLEAMASGMPVLATRHGGIPEAVIDAQDGFLSYENDAEGLLLSMKQLTDSAERYRSMGHSASESVCKRFALENQVARLEMYYDEAIG